MSKELKKIFNMDDAIGFHIERTEQALKRGLLRKFKERDVQITTYQWIILYRLWEQDGLKQADLASLTFKDKASVTRIIDVMEKHSLVVRRDDPNDRRVLLVYLTEKGRSLEKQLPGIASDFLAMITEGISPAELQTAIKVLDIIYANARTEF